MKSHQQKSRAAISLMEVIFAIGVLLTGLMGLASVLPIAANNAKESLNQSRASEIATNQSTMVRTMLANGSASDSYTTAFPTQSSFTASSVPGVGASIYVGTDAANNFPAALPTGQSSGVAPPITLPNGALPSAFCLDPWFLTAADTRRPDAGPGAAVNAYDRTLFPCYDDRYNVYQSPSQPPSVVGWSLSATIHAEFHRARRIPRIGFGTSINLLMSELITKDRDTVSVIKPASDSTFGAGLFVKQKRNPLAAALGPERATTAMTGRYSYMVTVNNGSTHVVTFTDRVVTIDPSNTYSARHNLAPYTAASVSANNIPPASQTFHGERLGYVVAADSLIQSGRGTFTYQVADTVDPSVSVGDWVCLLRRSYVAGSPPTPDALQLNWYRVVEVNVEPTEVTGGYQTQISVVGPDWTFHPIQRYTQGIGGPYVTGPTATPPIGIVGSDPDAYDATRVNGNPSTDNPGHTGTQGDVLYGTQIVLMDNVVNVVRF